RSLTGVQPMNWITSWLAACRPGFRARRCGDSRRRLGRILTVEPLQERLAPAALVNPTTLVYHDVDGDAVTVQISRGKLSAANFTFDGAFGSTGPQQLRLIDLRAAEFQGASLKVTATRSPVDGGDGFANVGRINATIDLGAVVVDGDLG